MSVADSWRARWANPPVRKPVCYNRKDYTNPLGKPWREGCPHWYTGGNAHVLSKNHAGFNGETFGWGECNGCKQKV